jgi:hypothetical protein
LYKHLEEIGKAVVLAMACVVSASPARPDPGHTTSDRVFSAAQALRGQHAYLTSCAPCHQVTMAGGGPAPELAGDSFMTHWNGRTMADLYQRIQATMPQTAPQSLPPQTYIDIVAYILSANGLPAGTAELAAEPDSLRVIKIVDPSITH